MSDLRAYFKKLVQEAKGPLDQCTTDLRCGSQRASWFEPHKKAHRNGKYVHLTDEYIDNEPLEKIQAEMMWFIVDCFRQR
jgi:hypothetical protein